MILPAVTAEFNETLRALESATAVKIAPGCKGLEKIARSLGSGIDDMCVAVERLEDALSAEDTAEIIAAQADLRKIVDALELQVSDSRWPLPKYREMLFIY